MTYIAMASLQRDADFSARVNACVVEQAKVKGVDDPTAVAVMGNGPFVTGYFTALMVSEPSFAELYDEGGQENVSDGLILSAVQALWDTVALVITAELERQIGA